MDNKIIYHGSNMKVEIPKIMINGYYKDFGYGFYCTNLKKQAIRWAMTKKGDSVINTYSYQRNENLQIKTFEEMTEEWLQFVVDCRRGIEHNYEKSKFCNPLLSLGTYLTTCGEGDPGKNAGTHAV